MKTSIRDLLIPILLLSFAVMACNKQNPKDEWGSFATSLLKAGHDNDTDGMIAICWTDVKELKKALAQMQGANPGAEITATPDIPKDVIAQGHKDAIRVFIDSYADLFSGTLASVVSRPVPVGGMESYSVIIWVQKGSKFYGIKLENVARTAKGLKVNDWLGPPKDPSKPESARIKQRALLERARIEDCDYPAEIAYECSYKL